MVDGWGLGSLTGKLGFTILLWSLMLQVVCGWGLLCFNHSAGPSLGSGTSGRSRSRARVLKESGLRLLVPGWNGN